jgi:hypothetical protein
MSNKSELFDRDYTVRFILICLIAVGLVVMAWTFKFKSDVIVSLDENNSKMFEDKFIELATASQYGEYRELNLTLMKQKSVGVDIVDRSNYGVDVGAFKMLPIVPVDWGKAKFAFDSGRFYILRSVESNYYLQPEFFDDWTDLGVGYHKNGSVACKDGMFASPSSQRIYTKAGASVETYIIMRASFCNGFAQSFGLVPVYPSGGVTDDGVEFTQDPNVADRFIDVGFSPDGMILGKAYPVFDPDWAQKVKVTINVADGAEKGIYIVSVEPNYYRPFFTSRRDVNYDSYEAKRGTPLVNFILAVD